jgi:hypothetical protein
MIRTTGKIHWMTVAAVAGIGLIGTLLMTGGEDANARATIFMSALARGDAQALAESTHVDGKTTAQLKEEWERTVKDARHYRFRYRIKGSQNSSSTSAQVRMDVFRNFSASSYEENFQLDLRIINGIWKVVGKGINREMYPFLPRFE